MGTTSDADTIIGTLIDVFYKISDINPFVFIISFLGVLVLVFYKKINNKFIRVIPAPMWVLLLSIPIVYGFDFFNNHDIILFGSAYNVNPDLLINIPENPLDSIMFPDFSKFGNNAILVNCNVNNDNRNRNYLSECACS